MLEIDGVTTFSRPAKCVTPRIHTSVTKLYDKSVSIVVSLARPKALREREVGRPWELYVVLAQFCCEPKADLNKIYFIEDPNM